MATDVSTAQFTPDGTLLLVHHRASTGGALERVLVEGSRPPLRLGDSVGDWILSPDGKRVAFAVKSTVVKDGRDLWVAALPDGKPVRVVTGTGPFAFSPDGALLARIERAKASSIGNLVVGPASGGTGRTVAERVGDFSFAPDGKAVAALANYDEQQRWGRLTYAPLPDGAPVELGRRVTTWIWSPDNKHLAFNLRVFQPLPSVDLWLYARGKPSGAAVMANVYGYDFGPAARCTSARSASARPGPVPWSGSTPPSPTASPHRSSRASSASAPARQGTGCSSPTPAPTPRHYDVAVLNLKTNVRVTLEERILLPALFADPQGTKVVYLVSQGERSGLLRLRSGPVMPVVVLGRAPGLRARRRHAHAGSARASAGAQ